LDPNAPKLIYKVTSQSEWASAESVGVFAGAPVDFQDGFIHFSTEAQLRETVEKHFQGQADLLVLSVEIDRLGHEINWEASRGGQLFPHLYAPLSIEAVVEVIDLPIGKDGCFIFPDNF
jgi:uncharacterized protein (DUF952 family)